MKTPVKIDNTLLIFLQMLIVIKHFASITQTTSAIIYSAFP